MLWNLLRSPTVHGLALQSKRRDNSTTACTTRALVLLLSFDFHSHFFTLAQAPIACLILASRSFFFPIKVPSILVFSAVSLANVSLRCLYDFHVSNLEQLSPNYIYRKNNYKKNDQIILIIRKNT